MTIQRSIAALLAAVLLSSCYEKNAIGDIAGPAPGARIKFFHFGVNAPGMNFYANDAKVTAISSAAAGSAPRARAWASAASVNATVATNMPGTPRASRSAMSCTLHDVQLPQSARASITAPHSTAICWRRSTGAGFVKVGFL